MPLKEIELDEDQYGPNTLHCPKCGSSGLTLTRIQVHNPDDFLFEFNAELLEFGIADGGIAHGEPFVILCFTCGGCTDVFRDDEIYLGLIFEKDGHTFVRWDYE
jgi:hypothetical protein